MPSSLTTPGPLSLRLRLLLTLVFFASGASALIFENLWFRQAGLAFGNSIWASSLVLSGFMAGLALGNALAARRGDRFSNPVRTYALLEGTIALTGIGLVHAFPRLGAWLAPWLGPLLDRALALNGLRFLAAFALLLVPSTAMGMTLPLLTRSLAAGEAGFGPVLGLLYGANTLGAVVGVIAGETWLLGALGVGGTAFAAGGLNLAAAAAAWAASLRAPRSSVVPEGGSMDGATGPAAGTPAPLGSSRPAAASAPAPERAAPAISSPPASPKRARDRTSLSGAGAAHPGRQAKTRWMTAAFLSGFALLALEVLWFRCLLLVVYGQSLAFALMLAVVLAGIALGGLAASWWLRLRPGAHRSAPIVALACGTLTVATYAAFPFVVGTLPAVGLARAPEILRVALPLMFPVSFLSGIFFTLVGAGLRGHLPTGAVTAGRLTLANTAGAALGALAGGLALLPLLGMERSIFAIVLLYGAIGIVLVPSGGAPRAFTYGAAALFVGAALLFPFGSMDGRLYPILEKGWYRLTYNTPFQVAARREGLSETLIYLRRLILGKPGYYTLLTNSLSMSSTNWSSRRYQKLFVYLPVALHPRIENVLLICYGVGNTAKAIVDTKEVRSIDVVDISRDILDMSAVVYPDPRENPLRDPRVRVHVEDGRYFLEATRQRYDLITGEPPPPGMAGVENLYSKEYFQLLHDRLAEGGFVTYWLPLHSMTDAAAKSILRAFCAVFEDCSLWNGAGPDLLLLGGRGARGSVPESSFVRQWSDPGVSAEMARLDLERPEQLGALFIGDAAYLHELADDAPPLDDDHPKRILAPFDTVQQTQRIYRSLTDWAAARDRFASSPLIGEIWPRGFVRASLPYFEIQGMTNAVLYDLHWNTISSEPPDRVTRMEMAYRVLTLTPLESPVSLLLAAGSDVEDVVATLGPGEASGSEAQYFIGVGSLSARDYGAAAESFARAQRDAAGPLREEALVLQVFALCLSGRTEEAQRVAADHLMLSARETGTSPGAPGSPPLDPVWSWFRTRFGIDPLTPHVGP